MADMNFGEPSGGGFIDHHFDFTRCQRPDGSFYGTSGMCRKGTQVGAKEKDERKLDKADTLVATLQEKALGNGGDVFTGAEDVLNQMADEIEDGYSPREFAPHAQVFARELQAAMEEGMDAPSAASASFESMTGNGRAGFEDAYALATYGRDLSKDMRSVERAYTNAGMTKEEAKKAAEIFEDSLVP